jgi:hypothetical protein
MRVYANAKLGPAGRRRLVLLIESGMSLRAAAAARSVSPFTAHWWWHRLLGASAEARTDGSWLGIAPAARIASRG